MYAFSFTPKNDTEIEAFKNRGLLPDGIYPFTVKEVNPEMSRANNPMIKVRIGVLDKDGSERNLIDYLLSTDAMMFKLKHFCDAIGFEAEYAKGSFDIYKTLNRSGQVKIGIQKGNAKDDGSGFYPDKNTVKDYIKGAIVDQKKPVAKDELFNQDIPF